MLISRSLLNNYKFLAEMNGKDFRILLGILLKDPDLWNKIRLLESEKYTKTYQREGLDLVPVKFYPYAKDWCELSVLSNGTGFSRCYIFIYLLEFYLGIRSLSVGVTNRKKFKKITLPTSYCIVKVDNVNLKLERNLKTDTGKPHIINVQQLPSEVRR